MNHTEVVLSRSGVDQLPLLQPLLGTAEAARAFGVSRVTVAHWVKAGRIQPAHTLPGSGAYVFTADEVERVAGLPRPRRGRPPKRARVAA